MLSYTGLRNLFGDLTNDASSANLTLADTLINNVIRKILRKVNWPFLERTASITTVASQQDYDLPYNFRKILATPYLTVSSTQYPMKESPTREHWNWLNQTTTTTSDIPEYFYIFNKQISIYPTLSSASNTITVPYLIRVKDLSVADYTTGTITTTAASDETVVGSGTSWTAQMANRYLRITDGDAAGSGDGEWYEIASVTDGTNLELQEAYAGTAITAGSAAYAMGQMPELPEEFHILPVNGALQTYFTSIKPERARAQDYGALFQEGMRDLLKDHGGKSTSPAIIDSLVQEVRNPNLFVEL
ncbi:hypothetical protein CL633_04590 [bacterium]|jgi:hypothetical protein|nr:hypothetical protein [bacterium]|tara:strand:+ start:12926 stop:13834 length:909 start_codon:yes stop_codon:yes gene_type:complete